jgi:transcriptional regulator with XRE-family HTH domain
MPDENTFGNVLKSLRVRKGTKSGTQWTQILVAKRLGVSRATYNGWENGKSLPGSRDLDNIAELFELNQKAKDALYRAAAAVPPELLMLPLPRNPLFTGRTMQLKELREKFEDYSNIAITQAPSLTWLQNIGKTQLALEYAYRAYYAHLYRAIFWVDASTQETLETDYTKLAQLLGLPEKNEPDTVRIIEAVKRWLGAHTGWLLVLDGAHDIPLVSSFMPTKHNGNILITTRSKEVAKIAIPIEIVGLLVIDGVYFFLRHSGLYAKLTSAEAYKYGDVFEDSIQLVYALRAHPVALERAAAYIEETGISIREYVDLYNQNMGALINQLWPQALPDTSRLQHRRASSRNESEADQTAEQSAKDS